ncbi:MAG: TIGR02266 family protein [Proteobacteria bacterium]|nr:TIGR02266 family protein [Pseudomonadota bacterium]
MPRRYPRFPLRVEITYASEHNFFSGMLQNVGGGGLFIATRDLLPLGARVDVEFSIPGRQATCLASCEVAWLRDPGAVHAGAGGSAGMGLRFVELDSGVGEAVQRFIQHREPIFFEDP